MQLLRREERLFLTPFRLVYHMYRIADIIMNNNNYEFVFFACIFIQDIFLIKKFSCMGNVTRKYPILLRMREQSVASLLSPFEGLWRRLNRVVFLPDQFVVSVDVPQ